MLLDEDVCKISHIPFRVAGVLINHTLHWDKRLSVTKGYIFEGEFDSTNVAWITASQTVN